ncbi:hypothetical protein SAMN05660703_3132 [Cellulophaga tyrosinoxydans]|uniref:Uncharacterized protein n=1 Tax=Cellulophaga tyrosinoxydans TaxID=504486 RepID=A0A1W2CPR5_9FLAO|nr:hypothetical protein SAMN05660703_3132 [Cellulophaga tyrosinoxydans]
MDYVILLFWFYIMIYSAFKIYKAHSELNKEIKRGNLNVYLNK